MIFDENAPTLTIDDVALVVNKITFLIDLASNIVDEIASIVALEDNIAVCIFFKDAHHILNVETLASIVEELL